MAENDVLRRVPSVERLLQAVRGAANGTPEAMLLEAAREAIRDERTRLSAGESARPIDALAAAVAEWLDARMTPSLRRVINASGVILQTNLGRAPLSERAIAAMSEVAAGYSNLEFDLAEGGRGSRHNHVRAMIRQATGAEDGIAVNNNAAALFMVLQVFAAGREVVISRGQAVEIGGGFRIPDVCRQSGAVLAEVGTTNRTYLRDYIEATGPETAAWLRVHSSNFRVVGFTASPGLDELSRAARERGVLLIDDLGSGCLLDTTEFGMAPEPTVQESLAAGVDLVLFSGDKLLGGPQCGIIAGSDSLIGRLRAHPLARALRVDKLTIAALNATLMSYVQGRAVEEIPVWRMAGLPLESVRARAERWCAAAGDESSVVESRTMVGGGSLPGEGIATWCARIAVLGAEAHQLAATLRGCSTPIVGRIEHGALLLDPRTVFEHDDDVVVSVLKVLTRSATGETRSR